MPTWLFVALWLLYVLWLIQQTALWNAIHRHNNNQLLVILHGRVNMKPFGYFKSYAFVIISIIWLSYSVARIFG